MPTSFQRLFLSGVLAASMFAVPRSATADGDDVDFDADGADDITVYRQEPGPFTGFWFVLASGTGQTLSFQWGLGGDIPVPGQYSDNSHADIAVYRPSTGQWFTREWNADLTFTETNAYQWGGFAGDIPLPCDYDGDSRQDLGIYRGGTWFTRTSPNFTDSNSQAWGNPTDRPIPRDYDNDGRCDMAIVRNGTWHILLTSRDNAPTSIAWGTSTDVPFAARFDEDGLEDLAVYRPGNPSLWVIRESRTQGLSTRTISWGLAGDIPVTSDIDEDQQDDIGVYRQSEGNWYFLLSTSDYVNVRVQQFGLPPVLAAGGVADVPVARHVGSIQ